MKPAARKYALRMIGIFAFYMASVIGINLLPAETMPVGARIAVSLIPVLPLIVMIFVIVDFVRSMDEVKQRIVMESCLVSLVLVGVASFTYGFLEGAVALPAIPMVWVFPALIGTAGIAQVFVRRRYI